ncbi:MAG: sigma-70 family RNA polymerase sigma factor [Nitrospirae bacterium]|nr:MAG: sigma-70 family RNA polymerase sigma factor [Nitrospirota bacterium]
MLLVIGQGHDRRKTGDSDLIERCLGVSHQEAWEEFVGTYAGLIWSAIHRTCALYNFACRKEDAEDLFNSIFLSLIENDFRKLRQFRGDNNCSLSTWLTVVAGRRTIDFIRQDKGHLSAEPANENSDIWETIADGGSPADVLLAGKQTGEILAREVARLIPRDRLIYHLLFIRGCSAEETAKVLGISDDLVYSRKHRIIKRLKNNLSGV